MEVGVLIKEYIDAIGMKQSHISKKTGIPQSKLSLALNGKRNLSLKEYGLICKELNVSADKFITPKKPKAN